MKSPASIEWPEVCKSLDERGYAVIPSLLSISESVQLAELYPNDMLYRSTIDMQQYRFGKGQYRYFQYPLPPTVQRLREELYTPLALLANRWMERLEMNPIYPVHHAQLINLCQSAGQLRPTPLILRYETDGFNTLHQDLYGDVYFPFQAVMLLSEPGKDFQGGEFVLVEQLPRAQSRVEVVPLRQGDALIFTTNFRPVHGSRGYYRAKMKHGVSEIRSGKRMALGIIFHDAK